MKTLLLLAVFSAALHASPACLPNTTMDGQPLSPSCYGDVMIAAPGSTWSLFANDNLFSHPMNDNDVNDLFARGTINATGDSATFTLLGGLSAHLDCLWLGSALLFTNHDPLGTLATVAVTPNALIRLLLEDTFTGNVFAADAGNRNFVITCDSGCGGGSAAPEPSTVGLFGAGLLAMLARKRRA